MAAIIKPEIVRYRGGTSVSMEDQPEGVAQIWKTKAFVFLNAAGQLQQCDPAVPGNITSVYGIVQADASGITGKNTRIEPVTVDCELLMSLFDSTLGAGDITSQSLVGKRFAITVTTISGKPFWVVDGGNAVDQIVQIQKIAPQNPIGEKNGAVYVKFLKNKLQYQP